MDKKAAKLVFDEIYKPTVDSMCREISNAVRYSSFGEIHLGNAQGQWLVLYRVALRTDDKDLIAEVEALMGQW